MTIQWVSDDSFYDMMKVMMMMMMIIEWEYDDDN